MQQTSWGLEQSAWGGGSGRPLSFTDLVVRKRTHSSNNKHFSSLVLGVGEVKGAWQLDMQPGDKLEEGTQNASTAVFWRYNRHARQPLMHCQSWPPALCIFFCTYCH